MQCWRCGVEGPFRTTGVCATCDHELTCYFRVGLARLEEYLAGWAAFNAWEAEHTGPS